MILRSLNRDLIPRSIADVGCFLLVSVCVPITYIFHVTVLMPALYDVGSFWYTVVWLAGLFCVFNITSNMWACMLVETSIRVSILKPPLDPEELSRWHMCESCQAVVPPRSWHCDTCKVCVLKRDHHCRFTCCCIGHFNYRYFFYFLIYICLGSLYVIINASIYLWYLRYDSFFQFFSIITFLMPALTFSMFASWDHFYLIIYELNILAFCISISLFVYNWPMIKRGSVMKNRMSRTYDLGMRANFEMVLGKRMYLTWLSPFVRSELPHDGINWMPGLKVN